MKRLAAQKPIAFSLLATVVFVVLMSEAFILGAAVMTVPYGKDIGEFSSGLAEEIVVRGLIFFCLLAAWKNRPKAALLSGVVSAAIFGYSHLVWVVLGKDFSLGFLQSTAAFCSGIFYAGAWIQTRSLWPLIVIHGLTNAMVYIRISELPDFNETISGGIMDITLGLPLMAYGLFFLWKHSKSGERGASSLS